MKMIHNRHVKQVPCNQCVIYGICLVTKERYETKPFHITVYEPYHKGAEVKEILKCLSKDDMEFVLSEISPEGWEIVNKEFEEENLIDI
jgi:hypothetical protein